MSRISVIIPCHAAAPYLGEALASLRAQTRPADEIVIADDGSTDAATLALLEALATPGSAARGGLPIAVLREPHRGPGPTRNAAVRASRGELVLPLDADDTLAPRALEKLEAALLADGGAAFAFPHVAYFGAVRGTAVPPRYNAWLQLDDNKLVVTALIRRSVFDSGAWYAEADGYEDWSFWLAVVERGLRGVCVEEPLFRYRRKASEGQLARDHGRREQLKAGLRISHAALFGDAARAELKSRWAAALEILWSGEAADPTLAALLRGQTFDDLAVTERQFTDAGELLHEARGKLLLWLGPSDLPALEALGNTALERLVRLAEERRDQDLIAVEAGDTTLLLLRTERASRLGRAHLPAGLPPRELASIFLRRGRGLQYPAAALATAADRPPIARTERSTPRPPSLRSAIDAAAPFFRTARARAAGAIGEERLGKLLHPWKERLSGLAWKLDGLAASLRAGRLPRGLAPILSPSERVERLLLDREPVRFGRPSKR